MLRCDNIHLFFVPCFDPLLPGVLLQVVCCLLTFFLLCLPCLFFLLSLWCLLKVAAVAALESLPAASVPPSKGATKLSNSNMVSSLLLLWPESTSGASSIPSEVRRDKLVGLSTLLRRLRWFLMAMAANIVLFSSARKGEGGN